MTSQNLGQLHPSWGFIYLFIYFFGDSVQDIFLQRTDCRKGKSLSIGPSPVWGDRLRHQELERRGHVLPSNKNQDFYIWPWTFLPTSCVKLERSDLRILLELAFPFKAVVGIE